MIPDVQYTRTSDGAFVAYQVAGDGPVDIVCSPGWLSNLDLIWEQPEIEPFLTPALRARSAERYGLPVRVLTLHDGW